MGLLEPCKLHDLTGCSDCATVRPPAPALRQRAGRLRARPELTSLADDGPGPWFPAKWDGSCAWGLHDFTEGTEIRADGEGGYECRECAE